MMNSQDNQGLSKQPRKKVPVANKASEIRPYLSKFKIDQKEKPAPDKIEMNQQMFTFKQIGSRPVASYEKTQQTHKQLFAELCSKQKKNMSASAWQPAQSSAVNATTTQPKIFDTQVRQPIPQNSSSSIKRPLLEQESNPATKRQKTSYRTVPENAGGKPAIVIESKNSNSSSAANPMVADMDRLATKFLNYSPSDSLPNKQITLFAPCAEQNDRQQSGAAIQPNNSSDQQTYFLN